MARPIWSGAITFGLVTVPVQLFTASRTRDLRFNQLHDADGGRIREKRVCEKDGEEVAYEHVIKGYPIHKGEYVPVTKEELAEFAPRASKAIDIEDFVKLDAIDPMFFDSTYYLAPASGAERPYALLLAAMRETGRVGIARIVLRTKQYLCAVRPHEAMLALSTMHYADELVATDEIEPPKHAPPNARELTMAKQLVESLAAAWKPEKYRDDYREKVMELIERKSRGEKIVSAEAAPDLKAPRDLAEALQESLARLRNPANDAPKAASKEAHTPHAHARGARKHRPAAAPRRKRK